MTYRIQIIKTPAIIELPGNDGPIYPIYIEGQFWGNDAEQAAGPGKLNDYIMGTVTNTRQSIVTRESDRWMLNTDGNHYDPDDADTFRVTTPWVMETVDNDKPEMIRTVLRNYMQRVLNGLHPFGGVNQEARLRNFVLHPTDPNGLLTADVLAMWGEVVFL